MTQRIVFLGSPTVAVPPLAGLVAGGFDVCLVITNPDRRRGRGGTLQPTPVKATAEAHGLPVSHDLDAILDVTADMGVVVAFGRIIPVRLLDRLPMINLHFSLLPRWRGAAPVERAVMAGDTETGVDLMAVEAGLDTGGIYRRHRELIGPDETAESVRNRLVVAGSDLLVTALREGLGERKDQVGEPTYAAKIDRAELEIDWSKPASTIHNLVRVGGAWTIYERQPMKIWTTSLQPVDGALVHPSGDGTIYIVELQPSGKRRMTARDWTNGVSWSAGDHFG